MDDLLFVVDGRCDGCLQAKRRERHRRRDQVYVRAAAGRAGGDISRPLGAGAMLCAMVATDRGLRQLRCS